MSALQTLNLLENVMFVLKVGLDLHVMVVPLDGEELTVMSALQNLDLLGHATPALLDGLDHTVTHAPRDGQDQIVSIVKDSDSALKVTALNVSRTDTGKDVSAITISMFI